jgi:fumarate reductase flavoprotein subunit
MKTIETDVIVVGGGAAGLAAAISAAEREANVAVFEKASTTGGCANMAMGLLGLESRDQKMHLVDVSLESAFRRFMDYTHWRSDARLVRSYLQKATTTIGWLKDMGVEFALPSKYFPGSEATWHIVKPKTGLPGLRGVASMIKSMTERAEELGTEIYLETPVKSLIKEDGAVVGIVAQDKNGETIEARGGAVIIATGGFGDNPNMIKEYTGFEWGKDLFSYRIPGLQGEGIKMAWDAGAAEDVMAMELVYFAPETGGYAPVELPFRQANLMVNQNGQRFINEQVLENPVFSVNSITRQPGRVAYSIIDSAIMKHYDQNGLDLVNVVTANFTMQDFHKEFDDALVNRTDIAFEADSIEELAQKLGIDGAALRATVDEYNEYCKTRDKMFDKESRFLRPLETPQFYALKFMPSAYGSLGGVKINARAEAVDKDSMSIKGLYACGTDANSVCDMDYVFILPGNTLGFAVNSGRIAGESAVEYIKECFS